MRMRTSLPSKNDAPWDRSKLFSQRFLVSALASALLISSSAIRHLIGCLIAIVEGSVSFRPNRWAFILGVWPDTEVAALNANNGLRAQNPCTGVSRIRAFTTPQTMKARDLSRAFFLSRLLGGEQKRKLGEKSNCRNSRTLLPPVGNQQNTGYTASCRRSGTRHELQSDTVHAVAQPRGRWAVVENMSKMAATAAAMHFIARNKQQGAVLGSFDRTRQWPIKTRPSGAAVELRCRGEQRQFATRTGKLSLAFFMIERA